MTRMLPPLADVPAALSPVTSDDLRTANAPGALPSPTAQAAERDTAERWVAPQMGVVLCWALSRG